MWNGSRAVFDLEFSHSQSRASGGIVMVEEPVSNAPLGDFFTAHLPLDAAEYLNRNVVSQFHPWERIRNAQFYECQFRLELGSVAFGNREDGDLPLRPLSHYFRVVPANPCWHSWEENLMTSSRLKTSRRLYLSSSKHRISANVFNDGVNAGLGFVSRREKDGISRK